MTVPRLVGLGSGPTRISLVRHGESRGNVADAEAARDGLEELGLDKRDADVALSERGERQARALASWLAGDDDEVPTLVLSSPYRRALDTARLAVAELDVDLIVDERLRERDLGVLDGLTQRGIRSRYADEADRRQKLGKFYYKPPSGESWADVVLRVRSLLADLRQGFEGARLWIVTHQAVIMGFRYVLEGLDEEQLLDEAQHHPVPNASLTTYVRRDGELELAARGDTTALEASGELAQDETESGQAVDSHV